MATEKTAVWPGRTYKGGGKINKVPPFKCDKDVFEIVKDLPWTFDSDRSPQHLTNLNKQAQKLLGLKKTHTTLGSVVWWIRHNDYQTVRHINYDRHDCRLSNLEVVGRKGTATHASPPKLWPGRLLENGETVPPVVFDQRHYKVLARQKWTLNANGIHCVKFPASLRRVIKKTAGPFPEVVTAAQFVWLLAYGVYRENISFKYGDISDCRVRWLTEDAPDVPWQVNQAVLVEQGKQKCLKCGTVRPVDQFYKDDRNPSGRKHTCIECRKVDRLNTEPQSCEFCGKSFTQAERQLQTRFCSDECSKKSIAVKCSEIIQVACTQCGKTFGRTKQGKQKSNFCSEKCQEKSWEAEVVCECCGKTFITAKYWAPAKTCSLKCKGELRRTYYTCKQCGQKFCYTYDVDGTFKHRSGSNDTKTFCSKRCYGDHTAEQARKRNAIKVQQIFTPCAALLLDYQSRFAEQRQAFRERFSKKQERKRLKDYAWNKPCDECGQPLRKKTTTGDLSLCKSCANSKRSRSYLAPIQCQRCGCQFEGTGQTVFCQKCQHRMFKNKRRLRKKCKDKNLPFIPSWTIQDIGDRAGWHCEICGQETLKEWRSFGPDQIPHPLGPTMEHIAPLRDQRNTKHGHTPENTQLACFVCNCIVKQHRTTQEIVDCDNPRQLLAERGELKGKHTDQIELTKKGAA